MSFDTPATKHGYVYVEPSEVKSILQLGYLSVSEQVASGIVTFNTLDEKYGQQYKAARQA